MKNKSLSGNIRAAALVAVAVLGLIALFPLAPAKGEEMTVFKSPTCGCCKAWVDHMRANGFTVTVKEQENLTPVKSHFGVPGELASCHTGVVDGYVIEGHVPAVDVKRLLSERPKARGLSVPGMPAGSPGMEMGDRKDPYAVVLFGDEGNKIYSRHE